MATARLPLAPTEGGCRCGRLRFRVTAAPLLTLVCHCGGCQRMTGGAFSATAAFALEAFAVICGDPVLGGAAAGGDGADGEDRGDAPRHYHCPSCKCWTCTRIGPDVPFVTVRATLLDDATWTAPFVEVQTADRLPWVHVAAPHSFARFPDLADWKDLFAGYAAWDDAPAGVAGEVRP